MLLPVLDLEVTGGLGPTALTNWTKAWPSVYERTGARAVIYTSPSFWRSALNDSRWFADNGYAILWVAHWGVSSPSVPASNWGGRSWTFWQYTSSGTVPGISGGSTSTATASRRSTPSRTDGQPSMRWLRAVRTRSGGEGRRAVSVPAVVGGRPRCATGACRPSAAQPTPWAPRRRGSRSAA